MRLAAHCGPEILSLCRNSHPASAHVTGRFVPGRAARCFGCSRGCVHTSVIRNFTLRVRTIVLGSVWVLGTLVSGQAALGAGQAQEPETQDGTPAPEREPKTQETDKAKPVADGTASDQDAVTAPHHGLSGLGKDFLEDQKQIWTSPAQLRFSDADWLVPVSGFAAGLFLRIAM